MKVVIVGGNAAGMSAASRLIRKCDDVEVKVFEKTREVSYGACGLPYFISDANDDINKIRIRSAEAFRKTGIILNLNCPVKRVDTNKKIIFAKDTVTGKVIEENYDKLIISSGSRATVPPIKGIDSNGVYSLKNIEDAENIKSEIEKDSVKRVAIIGGGYIGIEICEACHMQDIQEIHLFETMPQILNGFDEEYAKKVEDKLKEASIKLYLEQRVSEIKQIENKEIKILTSEKEITVDLVVLAIGVTPNTDFIDSVEKLKNGAIIVDNKMQTSISDVYAAGDCATVINKLTEKPVYLPLGTNANKQGRLLADHLMNKEISFKVLGTAMLRTIGCEIARTGLNLEQAIAAGHNAADIKIESFTKPKYFGETHPIWVELCYDKDTKVLLGAQVLGEKDAIWRINVFACAIDNKMTAKELGILDMGYAPPFTRVWDAVHIAANVIG